LRVSLENNPQPSPEASKPYWTTVKILGLTLVVVIAVSGIGTAVYFAIHQQQPSPNANLQCANGATNYPNCNFCPSGQRLFVQIVGVCAPEIVLVHGNFTCNACAGTSFFAYRLNFQFGNGNSDGSTISTIGIGAAGCNGYYNPPRCNPSGYEIALFNGQQYSTSMNMTNPSFTQDSFLPCQVLNLYSSTADYRFDFGC